MRDEKPGDEKIRDEKMSDENLRTKKMSGKIRRTKISPDSKKNINKQNVYT